MIRALDVANFFIDLANNTPEECMTNLRVNKLLYFAQGWSLAKLGRPLFKEAIQAWDLGPVVPSVYHAFKPCGSERIRDAEQNSIPDKFTSEQIDVLLDVVRTYGQYSTPKLIAITHEKGSPWERVYQKDTRNICIPNESMKEYFLKQKIDTFTFQYDADKDVVGYRDEEGCLVLPKDWDDDE